jgi:uncharacterized C2H2 Zn-finger protein
MAGNVIASEDLACNDCQGGFIFNGYGIEEFGLTSELFKKMDDTIKKIKSVNPANNQPPVDAILIFDIAGSASADGERSKNDKFGLLRAGQVESYLFGKFPYAKFHSYSTGPEFDSRQVEVKWKFIKATTEIKKQITPQVKPETTQKEKNEIVLRMVAIGVCILFMVILVFIAGLKYNYNLSSRKKFTSQNAEIEKKDYLDELRAVDAWPSELPLIAEMYFEKKDGRDLRRCPVCNNIVSGKKYVAHLRKCQYSPLYSLDNSGAVTELQKHYNQSTKS